MHIGAVAEAPDALEGQLERPARDRGQLGVQVGGDHLGDLAEEAQGHVQRLERPPPGPRDALLPPLQALADLGRDGDGGEQADHDLSTLATTGARRPTITFTPLALGWMPSPWFRPWVSSTPPRRFG